MIKTFKIFHYYFQQFMEENIPYRRLKKLKPNKINQTSQRILRQYPRKLTSSKDHESIMSQNVTQYQQMLTQPHLKQNYIKWATNLRGYTKMNNKQEENREPDVPSVFHKKTLLGEIRQKLKNQTFKSINTAQYSQFFGKDSTNIPSNQINFLNELRKSNNKQKNSTLHEERFKNYGSKQSQILPKLLKKSAIKKLRNFKSNDYQCSLDGTHMYPEYTYKNLREKNSALITSLCKSHTEVSLPGVAWSVGLRSY